MPKQTTQGSCEDRVEKKFLRCLWKNDACIYASVSEFVNTKYELGWSDPRFCPSTNPDTNFWERSSSKFIQMTMCSETAERCTKSEIGSGRQGTDGFSTIDETQAKKHWLGTYFDNNLTR